MEIKDENYYGAMFYIEMPKDSIPPFGSYGLGGNVLASYWKEDNNQPPNGKADWVAEVRFRYYKSLEQNPAGKSDDKFSRYMYRIKSQTEEEMDQTILTVFRSLGVSVGVNKIESINMRCRGNETIAAFERANKPWMHITKIENESDKNSG